MFDVSNEKSAIMEINVDLVRWNFENLYKEDVAID